jgi:hypothetical protein
MGREGKEGGRGGGRGGDPPTTTANVRRAVGTIKAQFSQARPAGAGTADSESPAGATKPRTAGPQAARPSRAGRCQAAEADRPPSGRARSETGNRRGRRGSGNAAAARRAPDPGRRRSGRSRGHPARTTGGPRPGPSDPAPDLLVAAPAPAPPDSTTEREGCGGWRHAVCAGRGPAAGRGPGRAAAAAARRVRCRTVLGGWGGMERRPSFPSHPPASRK